MHVDYSVENNNKVHIFEVGDRVRISKERHFY